MSLLSSLRMRERLAALTLLLVLLAVLTGVSFTQAGLLDHGADQLEDSVLPMLRRTQDVRRLIDEARGLEALQFLADSQRQRAQGRDQLQRQRRLVEAQLAATARPGEDDEDRRLRALVQERLAQYWAAQDKVLDALDAPAAAAPVALAAVAAQPGESTTAPEAGPAAPAPSAEAAEAADGAATARLLLARESQAAWQAVSQALVFWYQHQEQRAATLAQQSRSQAQALRWGVGLLLGLLLAGSLAVLARRRRGYAVPAAPPSTVSPSVLPVPGLPETLESIAMHSRLVALNAAVQAARTGAPTDADLAERAHLASEAEALARRCDEARRSMRLAQPKARSVAAAQGPASGFESTTRP